MTAFGAYMWGFGFLLAGLSVAAYLLGVPILWIVIANVILLALGFLLASSRTR
jgi:hypothetical protein